MKSARHLRKGPVTIEWLKGFIVIDSNTECWNWQRGKTYEGYGVVKQNYKMQFAHRLSFELLKGPIPSGLWILHKCDNPSCINPEHLRLGTPIENTWDAISKGRFDHSLSQSDVENIRASHDTQSVLAKRFGVNQCTISRIKTGKRRQNKLGQPKELYANSQTV